MARIRTIKPEFWGHEGVAALTPLSRLLYVATWNQADDEGLLRWTPAIIRGAVFPYDDDLDVRALMAELEAHRYVHAYQPGSQRLGWIVNFRKHQRINRPQPSRLAPPDIDDPTVIALYADRDDYVCARCRQTVPTDAVRLTLVVPLGHGGTTHPSNVATLHTACAPDDPGFTEPFTERLTEPFTHKAVSHSLNGSLNHSLNAVMPTGDEGSTGPRDDLAIRRSVNAAVNAAVNGSLTEREGEGEGEQEGEGERANASAADAAPPRCRRHAKLPADDPGPACVGCRSVRLARERADAEAERRRTDEARTARVAAQIAARRPDVPAASTGGRQAAQDAFRASQARKRGTA